MTSRSDQLVEMANSAADALERTARHLRGGHVFVAYWAMSAASVTCAQLFVELQKIGWDFDTGMRSRVR